MDIRIATADENEAFKPLQLAWIVSREKKRDGQESIHAQRLMSYMQLGVVYRAHWMEYIKVFPDQKTPFVRATKFIPEEKDART